MFLAGAGVFKLEQGDFGHFPVHFGASASQVAQYQVRGLRPFPLFWSGKSSQNLLGLLQRDLSAKRLSIECNCRHR